MFYSDVDTSCIQPNHFTLHQSDIQQDAIMGDMCGICHEGMDTTKSRSQATTVSDVLKLSCGHMFHYECLRDACLLNKLSNTRICSICRKPYERMHLPEDDTFHQRFHKTQPKNAHLYEKVDWNTIEQGVKVHIVKHSAKHESAVYMSQTKCYARLKSLNGKTFQCIKHNVLLYK